MVNEKLNPIYAFFWICLAYFISFILIVVGVHDNNQSYIYYGLFFLILGVLMNISLKLSLVLSILENADVMYELSEEWEKKE